MGKKASKIGLALLVAMLVIAAATNVQRPVSDHFDGTRFYNIGEQPWESSPHRHGFFGAMKWLLSRHAQAWTWRDNQFHPKPKERIFGKELVVTFVNHATVLIQTEGLNILTDPVWSYRVGPTSFIGPHRYRPPGIRFDDLPPIDVVLISHNHYDHMDIPTLRKLQDAWKPMIFAGLGNSSYLKSEDVGGAQDLDWWDKREINDSVAIACVPAQHFSGRSLGDRDETLWCGYVIETPHGAIYFAGDTGYGLFVSKIHEHYSGFRLALLPIGAYLPRWFMQRVHESPDEALEVHDELNVKTSVAIHFGTFPLADDTQDEAPQRIHELLQAAPEPKPNFLTLDNGESATIP